jgi:hypothetical protein
MEDNLGLMSTKDSCELGLVLVGLGLCRICLDKIGWNRTVNSNSDTVAADLQGKEE